jgi:peptide/nickel transport system substrate-binding protein
MRLRKPAIALGTAALLALAACGGGGGSSSSGNSSVNGEKLGQTGSGKDPTAKGPVTIAGAKKGGTVTVYTATGLTTPIDPSNLYYTDTSAIGSALLFRSLTQFKYDPKTKQMILIPDLATDLGTPNKDFTEWKFTIRDGIKWDNGQTVTAQDVAYGIIRSMDQKTFNQGAGLYYSNPYFLGGEKYKGPFTGHDPTGKDQQAVSVSGNTITIKMSQPFPDMPYYGTFPSMGPIPQGKDNPDTYALHPWSTGPYKIDSYTSGKSLVLSRNKYWDPNTDPGRTAYPDGYDFKAGQQSAQIDEIMLHDAGQGQTSLSYAELLAKDYRQMQQTAPDRVVVGPSPCTYYAAPDNRKITDLKVREALLWAYPYKDVMLASGVIPNVNAFPATSLFTPGVAGRQNYTLDGHTGFETDTQKAHDILQKSGNLGYEIKWPWRTDSDINTKSVALIGKSLTEAGFKFTKMATTTANLSADVYDNPNWAGNVRDGTGWCQDWPSGATWIPPVFQTVDIKKVGNFGTNYAAFSQPYVDNQIKAIQKMPLSQQADAWGALDKKIMTEWLPIIPEYYAGTAQAHGSKIHGMNIDTNLGEPTYKDIWIG